MRTQAQKYSRKTSEDSVMSARERYLARKQERKKAAPLAVMDD
jgi:hypothetical protein